MRGFPVLHQVKRSFSNNWVANGFRCCALPPPPPAFVFVRHWHSTTACLHRPFFYNEVVLLRLESNIWKFVFGIIFVELCSSPRD